MKETNYGIQYIRPYRYGVIQTNTDIASPPKLPNSHLKFNLLQPITSPHLPLSSPSLHLAHPIHRPDPLAPGE
jgi:hypothetical protein